ncbi:MAG: circularly permuted type 2 ATP-grasp protein, partial [Rhodospirillaceae bacterium]
MAFDEMYEGDGSVRSAYAGVAEWLDTVPLDQLEQRRLEAELFYRRGGITFAVYGDAQGEERIIPFDIIPRILSSKEWAVLSKGLEQRVKAINLYLADIYGKREILRAGIVPEDLVWGNPAYRPEMAGVKVPHGVYVHIAGIDIVRIDENDFYV